MKKLLILLLVLSLIGCATESETVKIGWISPLSGGAAIYGQESLNGALLAVEDINAAGGISGKSIELIVEDGACNPATAANAAKKLIDIDQVKIILGGGCSPESVGIVPITKENKVFQLAHATGTMAYADASPWGFRTTPTTKDWASALADYAYDDGARKVVIIAENLEYPQSYVDEYEKQFEAIGGKVLSREDFETGTSDFKTILLKMESLQPDAYVIGVQAPISASHLLKQMHEFGVDRQIYGDSLTVSAATHKLTGGLVPESAVASGPMVPYDRNPETKALLDRLVERNGPLNMDPFFGTEGYDGVQIMKALVKQCGEDVPCMREAILELEYVGTMNTFRWDEHGNPSPRISIYSLVNGQMQFHKEIEG